MTMLTLKRASKHRTGADDDYDGERHGGRNMLQSKRLGRGHAA
jgi:hypothetical protein